MMAGTMTLLKLFECGIAAENALRDFYLGLIRKFSSRPAVCAFWKTLVEDEEGHARILARSRDSVPPDRLGDAVDAAMAKKAETLSRLSVPETLDLVHNLNDAYLLAHELEHSDVNVLFNFLKLKLIARTENELAPDLIDRHLRKLIDFEKTFGDAEMRKRIVIDA
jgi:hypothetical protein